MAAKLAAKSIDTDRLAAAWQPRTLSVAALTQAARPRRRSDVATVAAKKGRRPAGDGSIYKAPDGEVDPLVVELRDDLLMDHTVTL